MALTRRDFLASSAAGILVGGAFPLEKVRSGGRPGIKAIAFDAFSDSRSPSDLKIAEALFPARGQEIMNAWRTRQYEYQWLRALGGQYVESAGGPWARHKEGFVGFMTPMEEGTPGKGDLRPKWDVFVCNSTSCFGPTRLTVVDADL